MAHGPETGRGCILTPEAFHKELKHIGYDSVRERSIQGADPMLQTLGDLTQAFRALQAHAKEEGDLFIDTEAPTDQALLLIFAFIVLP